MASNENENDAPQVYLLGKTYLANNQGQFYIRNDPIVNMAAGDRHTIIVTESGRAFAFGDNSSGQLGLGHTNNVEKVSCIKSLKFNETGEKVILVACGRESSLVATNRGSLYAFGSNSRSQLGIETSDSTLNQLQPAKIEHLKGKKWKQIAMGAEHACALTDEGIVYVWGSNEDGQCGQIRKHDTVKTPRELRIEYAVNAISCGYYHTALVSEDGKLFIFGNNEDRQLGRPISDKFSGPVEVSFTNKVKAVACGNQHTIVLTEKGEVYACGLGDRGQLGLGSRIFSSENFAHIPGVPKRVTAIAAGEAHTAVIGARNDLYVFGDGKHGKLGSTTTHSNEFEACFVEKFKTYNVLKVVCGGCQTIVLAQKKNTELKRSSESDEDIGNTTLSVTQRPKSRARDIRNKTLNDRSKAVGDSMDSTLQHGRPLGKSNNLRVESDDDNKSEKELSESLKSATFNQTHTITNGKFRPTQTPSLNRTSLRSNDDDLKPLRTGALDRTAPLNKDTEDLRKTANRLPSNERSPVRSTRFDQTDPPSSRKKRDSDDDDSSSEEQPKSFQKKPEQSSPLPTRNIRKPEQASPPPPTRNIRKPEQASPPPPTRNIRKPEQASPPPTRNIRKTSPISRRKDDSGSDDNTYKRSSSLKAPRSETLNRKAPQRKVSDEDEDEDEEEEEDDEEETPRSSNRQKKQQPPPPTVARRSSLPHQTRSGVPTSTSRDGNQTIGSRPVDGVRGSFRAPATKTLAKPTTTPSTDSTKKETPAAQQPGFFSRIFGSKSTPPPPPPSPPKPAPPATTTPAANTNSRTCSIM